MAPHIDKISTSAIPCVDKNAFWSALREGQILFCAGNAAISKAIQSCTKSPWSHVAMVVKVYDEWCVLEAVYQRGVAVTPIWQYIDRYDGDLVLCDRVDASGRAIPFIDAVRTGLKLLGRDYAVVGLVKEGLHRFVPELPAEMNDKECYCSGLQWLMSQATGSPFDSPKGGAPTPEDLWVSPTVVPWCALVRG